MTFSNFNVEFIQKKKNPIVRSIKVSLQCPNFTYLMLLILVRRMTIFNVIGVI